LIPEYHLAVDIKIVAQAGHAFTRPGIYYLKILLNYFVITVGLTILHRRWSKRARVTDFNPRVMLSFNNKWFLGTPAIDPSARYQRLSAVLTEVRKTVIEYTPGRFTRRAGCHIAFGPYCLPHINETVVRDNQLPAGTGGIHISQEKSNISHRST